MIIPPVSGARWLEPLHEAWVICEARHSPSFVRTLPDKVSTAVPPASLIPPKEGVVGLIRTKRPIRMYSPWSSAARVSSGRPAPGSLAPLTFRRCLPAACRFLSVATKRCCRGFPPPWWSQFWRRQTWLGTFRTVLPPRMSGSMTTGGTCWLVRLVGSTDRPVGVLAFVQFSNLVGCLA